MQLMQKMIKGKNDACTLSVDGIESDGKSIHRLINAADMAALAQADPRLFEHYVKPAFALMQQEAALPSPQPASPR